MSATTLTRGHRRPDPRRLQARSPPSAISPPRVLVSRGSGRAGRGSGHARNGRRASVSRDASLASANRPVRVCSEHCPPRLLPRGSTSELPVHGDFSSSSLAGASTIGSGRLLFAQSESDRSRRSASPLRARREPGPATLSAVALERRGKREMRRRPRGSLAPRRADRCAGRRPQECRRAPSPVRSPAPHRRPC